MIEVTARPWKHGWELHIEEWGVTQSRVLANAEQQVRDYIDSLGMVRGFELPADAVIRIRYDLGGLENKLETVRFQTAEAARLQLDAGTEARELVRLLRADGISVSDIAELMGVSRGRVSQLLADR